MGTVRTTAFEVKEIMNTSLTDGEVAAYITAANLMVTEVLGTTLGDDLLAEIERWLAAHMIASTKERQVKREDAGVVKMEYVGQYGEGLKMTSYGQMVLNLDTSGSMGRLGKKTVTLKAITSNDY